MSKPEYYALAVGEPGVERYKILNHICNPFSVQFLQSLKLKKEISVLDVGCGIGIMSCELANLIGSNGHVTAIDASAEQLTIAKKIATELRYDNIEFKETSAENLLQLGQQFDLIYCRFLLNTQKVPAKIFDVMYQILAPNGILICEEPYSIDSFFCYPHSTGYEGWQNTFKQLHHLSGKDFVFDFSLGQKLYTWYQDAGFTNIETRAVQPLLYSDYEKKQLRLQMRELTPVLQKFKLGTVEQIEKLLADLEAFEHNPKMLAGFFPFIQIAGIK